MRNFVLTFFLALLVFILALGQTSFAQNTSTGSFSGVRRGIATVMFAGLGGAVLGLSTLSFYGEPQEHIGNIWTGLALGVVGGSVYVLSQSSPSALVESSAPNLQASIDSRKKQPPMMFWAWNF